MYERWAMYEPLIAHQAGRYVESPSSELRKGRRPYAADLRDLQRFLGQSPVPRFHQFLKNRQHRSPLLQSRLRHVNRSESLLSDLEMSTT